MWCYGQGKFRVRVRVRVGFGLVLSIRLGLWLWLELTLPKTLTLTIEWVRALDWRPDGPGFEYHCGKLFASELWQFRLNCLASVFRRRQ